MILILLDFRYHVTGRFRDILRDLAEVGSFPEFHATPPEKSNKRAHGSDGPIESLPEDALIASLQGRMPTANSDQISPSLDCPGRSGTLDEHGANFSPPTSIITPGTQDIRAGLSSPSVAGSVSTPETSDYPSPGSFSEIFDGDTIPVTTNDLGSLPLHHGAKLPKNFGFGDMANALNTTTPFPTFGGVQPSLELAQGGVNFSGTQTGGIPGLGIPQGQRQEDLFPWMPFTNIMGAGGTPANPLSVRATGTTTAEPDLMSTDVNDDTDRTRQAANRLDSTISSLFGDVPSSSSTGLGRTAGFSSGPASDKAEDLADLFHVLFPSVDPLVGIDPSHMVQSQPAHDVQEGQGYGGLPANAQAYLHGWSNAPQAFQ